MAIIKRETDYALRALSRLDRDGQFLSVSLLAEEEQIPELFLRKIMQRLQHAELVESRQGPMGGYRLARPAGEVSLLDVVKVMQGPLAMNECFREPEVCSRTSHCPVRRRLRKMQQRMNDELDSVSIAQIRESMRSAQEAAQ